MSATNSDQFGYRCRGHCYGLSKCPHAELVYGGNGELVAVRCKLPKLIAPNTWLIKV